MVRKRRKFVFLDGVNKENVRFLNAQCYLIVKKIVLEIIAIILSNPLNLDFLISKSSNPDLKQHIFLIQSDRQVDRLTKNR